MAKEEAPEGVRDEPDDHFLEISIPVFHRITGVLGFDVFIKRAAGKYTKLFPRGEMIDQVRLGAYNTQKGVKAMFVHRNEYRSYQFYVERTIPKLLENPLRLSSDELASALKDLTDLTLVEIMTNHQIDQTSVNHAQKTVQGCIVLMAKEPKLLVKLFTYLSRHPHSIRHALSTMIFSILLGKAMKLESEKSLSALGIGSLLHDVGYSQLSFDPNVVDDMTAEQFKEMRMHPELGKRLLDSVKSMMSEVRLIVLQHHEQPNGTGYPNALKDREIYYLAKFVAIADAFSELTTVKNPNDKPRSALDALVVMQEDVGRFDQTIFQKFKEIFTHVR